MAVPIDTLLESMVTRKASDLYLTYGAAPALRIEGQMLAMGDVVLNDAMLGEYMAQLLTPMQSDEFESTLEINVALYWQERARFRINMFRQQSHIGIVIRRIQMEIPTLEELGLPKAYGDLVLKKRGLVLLAGPTGSGKTTSLAAMVGHRNANQSGHIITVEDPIEFVHHHHSSIITQRDVGLDTYSYAMALKNALRQRPDMVVIGEVRDREVMEQAIYFAETGHLCIATIHANNSNQAIERILNFFPEERHQQILMNLALNLRGILSQRLIETLSGERKLAIEVMLNSGLIRQLIEEGKIRQIREMVERGATEGMQTFDQHLFEMLAREEITEDTAIAESDNPANLRMQIHNKKSAVRMADFAEQENIALARTKEETGF
jgi:twitching motility protein PilU